MPRKKIVYILGAGFSKPAGVPEQKKLLPEILNFAPNNQLKNFLLSLYGHTINVSLEDIFTALDKSISENSIYHRFGIKDNLKLREDFINAIIKSITDKRKIKTIDYINDFAEKLISLRTSSKSTDPFAVISTNWDSLLDNSFESTAINKFTEPGKKRNIFLDYCTYTQYFDKSNIASNLIKAKGFTNIKLLKPHGSVNWCICPSCNSLFIKFAATPKTINTNFCKICKNNLNFEHPLRPLLISPTFLKDFNNVHLKFIWWNAGFELIEATHIVFIGYSLPLSDFELRYLFARSIKKAKIKVILFSENPNSPDNAADATKQRYIEFFGKALKPKDISFEGVENYIQKLRNDKKFYW